MENPGKNKKDQKQRHRQIRIIGGGGDIGAVVVWGGAMAVAGLVAGFAIKGWFGRRKKKDSAVKKEEPIKKIENVEEEEEEEGRVGPNDSNTNAKQTQIDFVSALLGEKANGATANTIAPQDIVPLINYAPITTVDPDVQEVIPFTKLKPELIADIVQECKSMAVEKPDPIGPVERLILKPVMSQLTLEAEALLSPRHDHDHNTEDEDEDEDEVEYEADEEEESADDEKVSEEKCISSSAIWPEEMIEELSRELKGMMIDLEEEDTLKKKKKKKKNKIMNSNKNEECDEKEGGDAKNEAVPAAVAKTAKLTGSSSWVRVSMLVTLLLLLLLFHFDAMFLHR